MVASLVRAGCGIVPNPNPNLNRNLNLNPLKTAPNGETAPPLDGEWIMENE